MMKKNRSAYNAYLTVYMALCLAVLTSLCLALIEGVRCNAVCMEAECITDIAMNSVLAEYHRELFRQYNILALDSSYGTGSPGIGNVEEHLRYYLLANMNPGLQRPELVTNLFYKDMLALSPDTVELEKAAILTDHRGAVLRRLASEVVKDAVGLTMFEEMQNWMEIVEINDLNSRNVAEEKAELDEKIQSYDGKRIKLSENEYEDEEQWKSVKIDNPTKGLEKKRKTGILNIVLDGTEELSQCRLSQEPLVFERMCQGKVNEGNMPLPELTEAEDLTEYLLFQEYLMQYMGCYKRAAEGHALQYQIEYLLAGKDNDIDNLRCVAEMLCAFREAANAAYIVTDQEKCEEAELAAAALSAVLLIPELKDLFTASILLGWSYAESLYDVKQLMAGEKVPLLKDSETWHYSLEGALLENSTGENSLSTGLSYEDYMRIFICLSDIDILTGRAMNMIEADIRRTPGNSGFRMDGCYACIEADISVQSRYGYSYEIHKRGAY